MQGRTWLASLSVPTPHREATWLDILVYAEEHHPGYTGRGAASKWLAAELGVDVRSAQRYLKLDYPPGRHVVRDAAERLRGEIESQWASEDASQQRADVAELLRLIDRLQVGKVSVVNTSGKAKPSSRDLSKPLSGLRGALSDVADAWEDEDDELAEDLLSDAVLQAYGEKGGVPDLHENLRITDYEGPIKWS